MPPPTSAELPETVLSRIVSDVALKMPPPLAAGVAGEGAAADRQRPGVADAAADVRGVAGEVLPLIVSVPALRWRRRRHRKGRSCRRGCCR